MTVYTIADIMPFTRQRDTLLWTSNYRSLPWSLDTTLSLAERKFLFTSEYPEEEVGRIYGSTIHVGYNALESVPFFGIFRKKIERDTDKRSIPRPGRDDLQAALWHYHLDQINGTLEKLSL